MVELSSPGEFALYWDGFMPYRVLQDYAWSSENEVVKVTIFHEDGHLDQNGLWDPITGSHETSEVSQQRNYRPGGIGYCKNVVFSRYACAWMDNCNHLGPNQVWIGDPEDRDFGIYPFDDSNMGRVEFLATEQHQPTFFYNNTNTAGSELVSRENTNRLHMAVFRVTIETVGERR